MELFSTTGFYIDEKVFVVLSGVKYFGFVVDIDDRLERVKVDYTGKNSISDVVVGWFNKNFWEKLEQ